MKDRAVVELFDLPCFGREARLCWKKVRLRCQNNEWPVLSWTWDDERIAALRQVLTDRAARWATVQVGRLGRSVSEVASEIGCEWHTLNNAVVAYGEPLVDDRSA